MRLKFGSIIKSRKTLSPLSKIPSLAGKGEGWGEGENGMILVLVLSFLAILSLLGATAVIVTTTDIKIGGNYLRSEQAFYNADAGVKYAIAKIEEGIKANPQTFSFPTSTDPNDSAHTSNFTYTVPSGFSFSISDITKIATNTYSFTSTGSGPNNAQTAIKVTFERDSAIKYTAFGNKKLDIKNGGMTQSYDSSSSDPTKNDPDDPSFQGTHEADVGANDWLVTYNGVSIDGSGVLGEKEDGSATKNDIHKGTTFYGPTPIYAGRIDPDPLGVNSGGEYDPTTYSANNDNASASCISGNKISLGKGKGKKGKGKGKKGKGTSTSATLYGKPGGTNYYLTSIELKKGATLKIDTSAGEVNIFLTGPFDAKNGSTIILIPNSKKPADFTIFSNSTAKIEFNNSSDFTGLVYAPYADVVIKNSEEVYGGIWGKSVEIKNSGSLYFDSKLKAKYISNNLSMTTWKETS